MIDFGHPILATSLLALALGGPAAHARSLDVSCRAGAWKLLENGRALATAPPAGRVWSIAGHDEDSDWLTVDLRASTSCGRLPDLTFDGGVGGWDGMSVMGGGEDTVTYEVDPARFGSGRLRAGGATIAFSNLEPVDVSGVASFAVTFPGANDVVTIANGKDFSTGALDALRISGTSGGVPFETVAVRQVTTLTIDTTAVDGADSITVSGGDNAHGIANVVVKTGAGSDTISIQGSLTVAGLVSLQADTISESGSLAAGSLAVRARSASIYGSNDVPTVAASTSADFSFRTVGDMSVGTVDGLSGVTSGGGLIDLLALTGDIHIVESVSGVFSDIEAGGVIGHTDHTITVQKPISTLGNQTLRAGHFQLQPANAINVPASGIVLISDNGSAGVHTGGGGPQTLNFTDADFAKVSAGTLVLQSFSDISVDGPVHFPGTLKLWANLAATQAAGAAITAPRLAIDSGFDATLADPGNHVGVLAARVGGIFTFTTADPIRLGQAYDLAGISAQKVNLSSSSVVVIRSAGDANGNGTVDVQDVFYLINYLFAGGPPP